MRRLSWFNDGFMRARQHGELWLLSDPRRELEPFYSFSFAVARRFGADCHAMTPVRVDQGEAAAFSRQRISVAWRRIWARIWRPSPEPL